VSSNTEKAASQLYVNHGIGAISPSIRLGARPEITKIEGPRSDWGSAREQNKNQATEEEEEDQLVSADEMRIEIGMLCFTARTRQRTCQLGRSPRRAEQSGSATKTPTISELQEPAA